MSAPFFDVSVVDGSAGCSILDLSTGFCERDKGVNSVYGSASACSAENCLSPEDWDTVHLYLSCYF